MRGLIAGLLVASVLAPGMVAAAPLPPAAGSGAQADHDASSGPPDEIADLRRASDYHHSLADALAAEKQPRSLALAALLRETWAWGDAVSDAVSNGSAPAVPDAHRDPQGLAWRKAAEEQASNDVATDEVLAGIAVDAEDPWSQRTAAKRWAEAEPDNLAPLFFTGDAPETVLAAAHSRNRFDLHWLDQVRWIAAAIERYPELVDPQDLDPDGQHFSPEQLAESEAKAMAALPRFSPLTKACEGAALSLTRTRRADCDALGHLLYETSDTWLARQFGIHILEGTTTEPNALAALRTAKRRAQWQLRQDGVLVEGQPRRALDSQHALLADPTIHTEMQLIERTLTDAHMQLDPPASWQPSR